MTARRAARNVYCFGRGKAEGRATMRELLGGKGANLAEMTRIGLPVPPGFTIATTVCEEYQRRGRIPTAVRGEIQRGLRRVEQWMGARLGDPAQPLLVSVRSGARVSMPGMMDTVLNLGLNEATVRGLVQRADERFALDSYRRLIQMYADVVLGVPLSAFEHRLDLLKGRRGTTADTALRGEDWRELVADYLRIVEEETERPFPQDPAAQLEGAIAAVFRSWGNPRARRYRRLHGIPDDWGTAVNVQAMVFGNMGDDCATGVAFTRDPSTGKKIFYGEYLKNAQGEDVVAGVRTPQPLNRESCGENQDPEATLQAEMPRLYRELDRVRRTLERHYRDMQDIEFTIQSGVLWLLQTRSGKRNVRAAVKIAVDMARERLITRAEALQRVDAGSLEQLLHPTLDPNAPVRVIAKGLPASPGAAFGGVVFSAEEAETRARAGESVLLVRVETSPEDIHGMHAASGILTARGGMTSHAAVVARGMGKCCVTGCNALQISYERQELSVDGVTVRAGEGLTLNGSSGEVMLGRVPTVTPQLSAEFSQLMRWADRSRRLAVRTNADTPRDAEIARDFGAEGIGLCRTEHMFFEEERILAVREMILADDAEQRRRALDKLLPMQRGDFEGIFRVMADRPVTVRLLDPPLHEFLPNEEVGIRAVAQELGLDAAAARARIEALREFNPMLGHRGCRLGITFPEIYEMQARAIAEAACQVAEAGLRVRPEIMVPLVADRRELERLRGLVGRVVADVLRERGRRRFPVRIGTMIEVPRAALTADQIAQHADFFSFGTNDLTQMAFALSRDDAGVFLSDYVERGILDRDPFSSIDEEGVGELIRMGVEKGRRAQPALKVGLCGEHGGDPRSVWFCHRVGLDYVSCSPFRVPVARLAAAQAAVQQPEPGRSARAAQSRGAGRRATRSAASTRSAKRVTGQDAARPRTPRRKSVQRKGGSGS